MAKSKIRRWAQLKKSSLSLVSLGKTLLMACERAVDEPLIEHSPGQLPRLLHLALFWLASFSDCSRPITDGTYVNTEMVVLRSLNARREDHIIIK